MLVWCFFFFLISKYWSFVSFHLMENSPGEISCFSFTEKDEHKRNSINGILQCGKSWFLNFPCDVSSCWEEMGMIISDLSIHGLLMNLNDLWLSPIMCAQIPLILGEKKTKEEKTFLQNGSVSWRKARSCPWLLLRMCQALSYSLKWLWKVSSLIFIVQIRKEP